MPPMSFNEYQKWLLKKIGEGARFSTFTKREQRALDFMGKRGKVVFSPIGGGDFMVYRGH